MKRSSSDTAFFIAILTLGIAGAAVIVVDVCSMAAGSGFAAGVTPVFGGGLLLIAACAWVCFALTGGEPPWGWARRSCERIRAWQLRESEVLRADIMRHLATLTPEERAREVERLTNGSSVITMDIPDKESFLHPRNWPSGRIEAPDGLSD